MFLPYYEITTGESGTWKLPMQIFSNPNNSRFNPYRDIQALGTTLGFRDKNYWFSDKIFIGKILKLLFNN